MTNDLKRYTAFVDFGHNGIEEIDVDAYNVREARLKAEAILSVEYQPGGSIIRIEERFGMYL